LQFSEIPILKNQTNTNIWLNTMMVPFSNHITQMFLALRMGHRLHQPGPWYLRCWGWVIGCISPDPDT
jgi:hypothetical protein